MQLKILFPGVFKMKHVLAMILIAFVLFFNHPIACFAKDMYVGDITKLNLRSGNGEKYPVITTLDSGEPVAVLSTAGEWTKISTMDGSEGWVVSKYLTEEKPADIKIEDLKIEAENLQGKLEITELENRKLKEENISLTTRLNENSIQLGKLEKSLNDLKKDSSQYLTLKEKYESLAKEINEKDTRIQSLEKKVDARYISSAIKWSLTGAGILLTGYFLGSRNKRKRSSLL